MFVKPHACSAVRPWSTCIVVIKMYIEATSLEREETIIRSAPTRQHPLSESSKATRRSIPMSGNALVAFRPDDVDKPEKHTHGKKN